jgi:CRISPR-associated endonuclease Cas1
MNALFIQRMSDYQHSNHALVSAEKLIEIKIIRSNILLQHFNKKINLPAVIVPSINTLLLLEGRMARAYWNKYKLLLPEWILFEARSAQSTDITNKLLDIGYHHLAHIVQKVLVEKECETALALLHRAQSSNAKPLVYDLMEMFRADLVDITVLTWLRQKKRPIQKLSTKHIAHFIHDIQERLEKQYYLEDFKQCHTYHYYIDLQITKFIKAVNHQQVFKPLYLPTRHDTRCTCKPPQTMP